MADTVVGAQPNSGVAPGSGAENPKPIAGPVSGNSTPPLEPAGKQGQPIIKIGDNTFTPEDVQGLLGKATGLEQANIEMKKKIDALEAKELTEKQLLEKQTKQLTEENASMKKTLLNGKIERALAAKGVNLKSEYLNLGVTDESQIETAVQKFINENPGAVGSGKPLPGNIPPGMSPPAGAPPSGDSEAELMQKFKAARTPEEFAKLNAEYHNMRGTHPREEGKII